MLKEALSFLFSEAQATADAKVLARDKVEQLKFMPDDGRTMHILHKGEIEAVQIPPALRYHHVDTVDDLINAAGKWKDDNVVWIQSNAVTLILNDKDRLETVVLELHRSPLFNTLVKLEETPKLDQAQLVRLLRRDLRGAKEVEALLSVVRSIKFKQHTEGYGSIQHGSESMGRSIENEVLGVDERSIPSLLVVPVVVYQNIGETMASSVGLDVEVLTSEQKFNLKPMPGELNVAQDVALADIRRRISEKLADVPIFYGRP